MTYLSDTAGSSGEQAAAGSKMSLAFFRLGLCLRSLPAGGFFREFSGCSHRQRSGFLRDRCDLRRPSLLSYECRVKRKRALQRCNSPRNSPVCDAPKVLVTRRRSDSAAGCFLGRPHVPDDFGHRSNAFKTSFSEVKPLKSPKNLLEKSLPSTSLKRHQDMKRVQTSGG